MERSYTLLSSITDPISFQHHDDCKFEILFSRACRFLRISQRYYFGLIFFDGSQKYWINNNEKFSDIKYFPSNIGTHIELSLKVMLYPLNLYNEILCHATVKLFFDDIIENKNDSNLSAIKTPEMDDIEVILAKRRSGELETSKTIDCSTNTNECNQNIFTSWELRRRYFECLDNAKYIKVTGQYDVCVDKRDRTVIMTIEGLDMSCDGNKYLVLWDNIKVIKVNGSHVTLQLNSENITKLKFNSEAFVKQFICAIKQHKDQHDVSSKASSNQELAIIKHVAETINTEERLLRKENVDLRKIISSFEDNKADLETSLRSVTDEKKNTEVILREQIIRAESKSEFETRLKELETKNMAAQNVISEKNDEIMKNWKDKYEDAKSSNEELKKENASLRKRIKELESEEKERLKNENQELKKTVENVQNENATLKLKIQELERMTPGSDTYKKTVNMMTSCLTMTEESGIQIIIQDNAGCETQFHGHSDIRPYVESGAINNSTVQVSSEAETRNDGSFPPHQNTRTIVNQFEGMSKPVVKENSNTKLVRNTSLKDES